MICGTQTIKKEDIKLFFFFLISGSWGKFYVKIKNEALVQNNETKAKFFIFRITSDIILNSVSPSCGQFYMQWPKNDVRRVYLINYKYRFCSTIQNKIK